MKRVAVGAPPRPIWLTLPGVFLQLFGMFLLPFVVGLAAAVFFDVAEVAETFPALMSFTALILLPVSLAQVVGLGVKSFREMAFHWKRKTLGPSRVLDVLYTHLQVITGRGWSLLFMSLMLVLASLSWRWASLGLMATIGLFLFYMVVGWTVFTSTFFVRTFESGIGRAQSGIERQIQPAVCLAGAQAEEVFLFRRTPVPWGYSLLVEETLPARLKTESRYQVGPAARGGELERRGRLRATPRGVYLLGPAQLWYSDALGITRISVASLATAELKVLPRIRPVEVIEPPRTNRMSPDVLTRPHRFATDDHFRFSEYAPGDDTRRIHWRLSMKTGALQVRRPETREVHKRDILLVIDSYIPKGHVLDAAHGADDILDAVVEAALGITRALVEDGNRVILVAAALAPDNRTMEIEQLQAKKGGATRWQDLGARIRWQSEHDVSELMESLGENVHAVVVTARFTASPPSPKEGLSTTWVFLDPAEALGKPDKHWLLDVLDRPGGPLMAIFTRPHPVGSEENTIARRLKSGWAKYRLWRARKVLRAIASRRSGATQRELASRGDAVYRIERTATHLRLRGLAGGTGGLG
ncbi:MAG: DUF58 domain-containing protein [Alphaproteobacteria bacterium]|nr:DUF58 domain-containing protein [Alphaproteobacteria bacterium]